MRARRIRTGRRTWRIIPLKLCVACAKKKKKIENGEKRIDRNHDWKKRSRAESLITALRYNRYPNLESAGWKKKKTNRNAYTGHKCTLWRTAACIMKLKQIVVACTHDDNIIIIIITIVIRNPRESRCGRHYIGILYVLRTRRRALWPWKSVKSSATRQVFKPPQDTHSRTFAGTRRSVV